MSDDDEWADEAERQSDTEVRVPRFAAVSPSAALQPAARAGRAASFTFVRRGEPFTGFIVIGKDGLPHAWVNRCPHVPYPLDFGDGEVLDHDGQTIVCANHGARFDSDSGRCIWGPARGRGLESLPLREDGDAWLVTITPEPFGWPREEDQ